MKTSVRVEVALMMGETGNTTQQHIRDDQTSEDGYIGPVLLVFKRHVAPLSQPPLAAFLNDQKEKTWCISQLQLHETKKLSAVLYFVLTEKFVQTDLSA